MTHQPPRSRSQVRATGSTHRLLQNPKLLREMLEGQVKTFLNMRVLCFPEPPPAVLGWQRSYGMINGFHLVYLPPIAWDSWPSGSHVPPNHRSTEEERVWRQKGCGQYVMVTDAIDVGRAVHPLLKKNHKHVRSLSYADLCVLLCELALDLGVYPRNLRLPCAQELAFLRGAYGHKSEHSEFVQYTQGKQVATVHFPPKLRPAEDIVTKMVSQSEVVPGVRFRVLVQLQF